MGNSAQRRKDKNQALISGESILPSQNMQSNEVKKEEETNPKKEKEKDPDVKREKEPLVL